jgi:hypothetical protein
VASDPSEASELLPARLSVHKFPFLEVSPNLSHESAKAFSDQFRAARLVALADAEAFDGIIHVVERLGSYLTKERLGDKGVRLLNNGLSVCHSSSYNACHALDSYYQASPNQVTGNAVLVSRRLGPMAT